MIAVYLEATVEEQENYYSPERVIALLRLYPYLLDSRPPKDPELAGLARRAFGPSGWREEAAAKRADIWNAIKQLEQRDWRAAYCVRAYYAVGLSLTATASYLARQCGREYHHSTIRELMDAGIDWMARDLGWNG